MEQDSNLCGRNPTDRRTKFESVSLTTRTPTHAHASLFTLHISLCCISQSAFASALSDFCRHCSSPGHSRTRRTSSEVSRMQRSRMFSTIAYDRHAKALSQLVGDGFVSHGWAIWLIRWGRHLDITRNNIELFYDLGHDWPTVMSLRWWARLATCQCETAGKRATGCHHTYHRVA